MSRHRYVKNLTEDDMYDDYYDDDDYYEEEEDDEYYYQQQQRRQQQQQKQQQSLFLTPTTTKNKKQSTTTTTTTKSSTAAKEQNNNNIRLVMSMGFSRQEAETTLKQTNGDVSSAIHLLVSAGKEGTTTSAAKSSSSVSKKTSLGFGGGGGGGISKPPPGFGGKPPNTGGITKPPAGFGGPPPRSERSPPRSRSSKDKDAVLSATATATVTASPNKVSSTNKSVSKPTTTTTTATTRTEDNYYPKPSIIPSHIIQQLQEETSTHYSMVVLGHVDAGKSTLMGQLLVQTNYVSSRLVTRYEKEASQMGKASFALAWVMDEHSNERERGITMEIATKTICTPERQITILDAPGHAELVPTMMTGTAAADVGLLVIAAPPSEFEAGFASSSSTKGHGGGGGGGGQTREHVLLARGLGVGQLIVVVNKMDTIGWSSKRFNEIQQRMKPFLKQVGFLPKRTTFVPVSGYKGTNISTRTTRTRTKDDDLKKEEESSSWYNGPTLLDALNQVDQPQRQVTSNKHPLRCIITDVYAEGKYVHVQVRIVQGICQVGDSLVILPIQQIVQLSNIMHPNAVVGLEHATSTSTTSTTTSTKKSKTSSLDRSRYALAGDLPTFTLVGMDVDSIVMIQQLRPGQVLSHCPTELRPPISRKVQAKILVLEGDTLDQQQHTAMLPIIRGAQVLLHMHSMELPAIVSKLLSVTPRGMTRPLDKPPPRILNGGANATIELLTKRPICIEAFDKCRALGRIVLRRSGRTIAMGIVEKVLDYT